MTLRHYDVSRAHFTSKTNRTTYIELPDGERARVGPEVVGLLLRTMYGTPDASHLWQLDYVDMLCGAPGGFKRGAHNAAVFRHETLDICLLCHGDGFVSLADGRWQGHVESLLQSR